MLHRLKQGKCMPKHFAHSTLISILFYHHYLRLWHLLKGKLRYIKILNKSLFEKKKLYKMKDF